MLNLTDAYRSTQVASTNPVGQVVLLYEGAIRHALRHLAALERGDAEAAHNASIRCQAIVSGLQETLDLAAGPIADGLDRLYGFILRRLAEGNITKAPRPTEEALLVLRGLLEAWQEIAGKPAAGGVARHAGPSVSMVFGASAPGPQPFAGGILR